LKRTVAVTATTGMAALELGMNTSTLHHWSGILDGRYSVEKLEELYQNDDKYSAAKQRILEADCLIIDEISMLTQKIFELVECVCRSVRKKDQCFGGLQVLFY
jgi:ATP-dependent DNA helicase PIF1